MLPLIRGRKSQHLVPTSITLLPPQKIKPLWSEPRPCNRGVGQGVQEEEGENSTGRKEGIGFPQLGFLLRILPAPSGTARLPCPAWLLSLHPSGMQSQHRRSD